MNIYKSRQWTEDIDKVMASMPWLDILTAHNVMITGAGGLICSSIADIFIRYNETHEKSIGIIAAARSESKLKTRFGEFFERPYFHFIQYDATKPANDMPYHADYIIHGAGNASPDQFMKEPVETMTGNFIGLNALLNYAKNNKTKRILYISSSEVYGQKEGNNPFSEEQYGYVDLLNSRNSYSVGKRAAETLCVCYADEYGVDSVIVRPGHIYGPTAAVNDRRVSSQWAYAAACGEDITMKSDGAQIRSYCYCLDTASAILTVLIRGLTKQAYNISNPESVISIRQMAEILTISGGVSLKLELPTEEEKRGFNPMNNSSLNSESLIGLGWNGCFDAETGFSHTVQILKEMI